MDAEGLLACALHDLVTAGGAKTSFETGAATVGVADIDAHTFTVSIDGEVVRADARVDGQAQAPDAGRIRSPRWRSNRRWSWTRAPSASR